MALGPEQDFRNPLQTGVEGGGGLGLPEETVDADGILLYADGSAENTPLLLNPIKPNGRKHDLRVHILEESGPRWVTFPGSDSLAARQNGNERAGTNNHMPAEVIIFEGHVPAVIPASA